MKKIKDLFVSACFSFRQATKVFFPKNWEFCANLDPFYLSGFTYVLANLKQKEKIKKSLIYILPIIVYAILQVLIWRHLNIFRLLINCAKIIICIFSLLYVKENWSKFSFYKIIKYATIFIFLTTVVSFFMSNSTILWRFNDIVNKYNQTRLHGLFLEPSELGFHVMILMIFLVGYFLTKDKKNEKIEIAILFLMNAITLYFARPLGAIVIGAFAIFCMLLYDFIRNFSKKKMCIYLCLLGVFVVVLIFMFVFDSPIITRLIDTISGNDASNYYRIEVSLNVMKQSLFDYYGLGFGFGNLNTEIFANRYAHLGLAHVVANSFQYFIIEGGIFAIVGLIILWYRLIRGTKKNVSFIKIGILVFLFLYQIFGGHFTSGLTWVLYGLCLSKFSEVNEV